MKIDRIRNALSSIFLFYIFCSFQLFSYSDNRELYNRADQAIEKWGKLIAPRFGLTYIGYGSSHLFDDNGEYKSFRNCYAINFASRELLTPAQARAFILPLVKAYWTEIDQNPLYNKKQEALAEKASKYKPDWPSRITPNMIGIKVTFWDACTERPLKPYLAQIRVFNNKIQYFYTDPTTKRLARPPVEEPLEQYLQ